MKRILGFFRNCLLYSAPVFFFFQFNLWLGVAWLVLMLPVMLVALFTVFMAEKRQYSAQVKYLAIGLVVLIGGQYLYGEFSKKRLVAGVYKQELSIMSYNLMFVNKKPLTSVKVILDADPDILLIQELTPDLAKLLQAKIGKKYPYQEAVAMIGTHGTAVYSKYPLDNIKMFNNYSNRPIAQLMAVQVGAKRILLSNVHFASPGVAVEHAKGFFNMYDKIYKERVKQIKELDAVFEKNAPKYDLCLMAGDFNTLTFEPIFGYLNKRWVNLHTESGSFWDLNFPRSNRMPPLVRIDHFLAKGKCRAIDSKVLQGGASDHLGVIVRVGI
jgi:endonuclease/exonuclease/phosphatase (EEP) superfamily protein YafD